MSRILILLTLCLGKIYTNTTQSDSEVPSRIHSHTCSVADYKFMVAILLEKKYNCAGSLLSSRWVLTARSCMKVETKPNDYMVITGVETPYEEYYEESIQRSIVKGCYRHPSADIGLMNLQTSIKLSPVVEYVTLATNFTMQEIKLEDVCSNSTTVGWQKQEDHEPNKKLIPNMTNNLFEPYLQCLNLPVLSREECVKRAHEESQNILPEWYFCVLPKNPISCWDSLGGPLLCDGIQYGILSYGYGCSYESVPGLYVKVYNFEDFINDTIRKGNNEVSPKQSCSEVKRSFLVAIIHQDTAKSYKWKCAGSLLTQTWVLTSGFCIIKCKTPSYYTVVAGLSDPFKFDPNDKNILSSKVVRCYQSPKQNELEDIALMKLNPGFLPSEKVSYVQLATLSDMENKKFKEVCSNGTLIGYGRPNIPLFHNLHCDKTTVTSDTQCKKIWSWTKIEDRHGCIDVPKSRDCYTTQGVPLVCHGVQYGVFSSVDCTDRTNPYYKSILIAKVYKYDLFLKNMIYDKIDIGESNLLHSNGNMNTPICIFLFFYFVLFLI